MSDTPRTDAEALKWGPREGVKNITVPTYFAEDLERELAEARRDAERYRWLRDCNAWRSDRSITVQERHYVGGRYSGMSAIHSEHLDAAIDAAMQENERER